MDAYRISNVEYPMQNSQDRCRSKGFHPTRARRVFVKNYPSSPTGYAEVNTGAIRFRNKADKKVDFKAEKGVLERL